MKTSIKKNIQIIVLSGAAIMLASCSTVVRENIIASIDTGIGASVAENKQTQMYELKAGYIHSQFYSIPTGKVVGNEKGSTDDLRTNRADITPQVVSGIHAKTSLADVLLGMEVSENFAVGSDAVKSAAATAMYIADAKTGTNATAAAAAVSDASSAEAQKTVTVGNDEADQLAKYTDDGHGNVKLDNLNKLVKGTLLEGTASVKTFDGKPTSSLKTKLMGSWRPFIPQMVSNMQ